MDADKLVCGQHRRLREQIKTARMHIKSSSKVTDISDLLSIIDSVDSCLSEIEDYADGMHKGAVKMEERLRLYRSAIESLGFSRT